MILSHSTVFYTKGTFVQKPFKRVSDESTDQNNKLLCQEINFSFIKAVMGI